MVQDPKVLEAKFKKAFSDETFAKKLMTLETPQEVQIMLRTKDIDLSVEEIIQVKDVIVERLAGGGELTDAQLENVSGGAIMTMIAALAISSFLIGAVIGGGVAVGVGGAWATDKVSNGAW